MFKNHSFNPLVGFVIAALAVLSIGTAIYSQQDPSSTADSRVGALDWYFNHDHAVLDGDNNVVSGVNVPGNSSPLDWYFGHDHAIIDGDNAVVSSVKIPVDSSPLDWYFSHDHAILDGDNNVVLVAN